MISRRLVIQLFGAAAIALALSPIPVTLAFSPEARNAKLDETLGGLVEGRSTPGIVVLILQNGHPVYSRSVGVREVGSAELIGDNDMFRLASMTKAVTSVAAKLAVTGLSLKDLSHELGRSLSSTRTRASTLHVAIARDLNGTHKRASARRWDPQG